MRFETSVVLFALGALTGASILEEGQLAHMTAKPSLHPEFLINQQDSAICRKAVDRIRDRSQNEDPNVAIQNSKLGSPYQDNSFGESVSFYWPKMPISDTSESLVDELVNAKFYRISDKFDPDTYSLWGSSSVEYKDPTMGGLKDCSLMTAAQTAAWKNPDRLRSLFLMKDLNENGVNTIKLYQMGIPVTVTVDDTLPFKNVNGEDKLMFAQASADGALWMPILEKAVAKLYGNYERLLGSSTAEALQTLSAAPYEELKHTKGEDSGKKLLAWMKERQTWGCRLTSRKESNDQSSDASGVIDSYDYTIESIFEKDGKPHVKLIDHRERCGWNITTYGIPIEVSFENYQKDYKTTKAYFDVDKYSHNHYAVYDVDTPKRNDNAAADENLVYETIRITNSNVSQYVYLSVYTHSAQSIKNTGCWDEQASISKQLWARNTEGDWFEFGQKNYVHLPYVWMVANSNIYVDVAVYWPPEDYSPHDFSVVTWAEKQPVKLESEKTHSNQSAKEFPLYSLDPDTLIYGLDLDHLSGNEPSSNKGKQVAFNGWYNHDDFYEVNLEYFRPPGLQVRINMLEDDVWLRTKVRVDFNLGQNRLELTKYCGKDYNYLEIPYGSETPQFDKVIDCGLYEMRVSVDTSNIHAYWYEQLVNVDPYDNVMTIVYSLKPKENQIIEPNIWRVDFTYGGNVRVRSNEPQFFTRVWDYDWSNLSLASTPSLLALESENTAEADTPEKHLGIGVIASVGSIAAASFFACVFMAKGKNAVNDDFERV